MLKRRFYCGVSGRFRRWTLLPNLTTFFFIPPAFFPRPIMKRFALPLLALLALAACDTWDDMWNGSPSQTPAIATGTMSGCPQVAVIRDLSVYQNPPAGDETSLIVNARMGN